MANVLMVPASGSIIFDSQSAGSSVITPLSTAPRLSYDNAGGLNITSYTSATSALDRFTVDGATGRLLSVSDALTGTIFSVNDAAGLPIIQVDSALIDVVTMGPYGTNTFVLSNTNIGIGTNVPAGKLDIRDTELAGSGALSGSALHVLQTWNTTGNPTAFKVAVLNTASGATSDLIELQTSTTGASALASVFTVDKLGTITTPLKVDRVAVTSAAATLTLNLTHSGTVLTVTNAASVSATLPTQNTVSTGYNVMIIQGGAGAVTIVAGTGNTLNSFGSVRTTAGIHAAASIVCTAANTYNVSGNLI
jgi:hypothetical protein